MIVMLFACVGGGFGRVLTITPNAFRRRTLFSAQTQTRRWTTLRPPPRGLQSMNTIYRFPVVSILRRKAAEGKRQSWQRSCRTTRCPWKWRARKFFRRRASKMRCPPVCRVRWLSRRPVVVLAASPRVLCVRVYSRSPRVWAVLVAEEIFEQLLPVQSRPRVLIRPWFVTKETLVNFPEYPCWLSARS